MSYKKANSGNVNPNFHKGGGYKYNCQSCVAVFEARLSGNDLNVLPFDIKDAIMYHLGQNPTLAYIDTKTGKAPDFIETNVKNAKECEKFLKSKIKTGERYAFGYSPNSSNIKHILEVRKNSLGQLRFYDPQSGKHYKSDLLNTAAYDIEWLNFRVKQSPKIFRIDNLELNEKILSGISKGKD